MMENIYNVRLAAFSLTLALISLVGCSSSSDNAASSGPVRTFAAGAYCFDNAIDRDGNIWVANGGNGIPGTAPGNSNLMKLSPSGALLGTYPAGTFPIGIAIDQTGNVWVENYGTGTAGTDPGNSNVTELSPSGQILGTFVAGTYPAGGIAIDPAGNIGPSPF